MAAAAIGIASSRGELLEVVAGAIGRPVGRKHHGAHRRVGGERGQRFGKRGDQRFGEAVARRRPVEGEDGNAVGILAQQDRGRRGRSTGRRAWGVHGLVRRLCEWHAPLYPICG